jgi:hypothetical protein
MPEPSLSRSSISEKPGSNAVRRSRPPIRQECHSGGITALSKKITNKIELSSLVTASDPKKITNRTEWSSLVTASDPMTEAEKRIAEARRKAEFRKKNRRALADSE